MSSVWDLPNESPMGQHLAKLPNNFHGPVEVTHYQSWFKTTKTMISIGDHVLASNNAVGEVASLAFVDEPYAQFLVGFKPFSSGLFPKPHCNSIIPPMVVDTCSVEHKIQICDLCDVTIVSLLREIEMHDGIPVLTSLARLEFT